MRTKKVRLEAAEWNKELLRENIERSQRIFFNTDAEVAAKREAFIKMIDEIIVNELTKKQQLYIIEYYFNKKSTIQIAAEYKVSASTVSRTINRGEKKICKLLKYTLNPEEKF